MRVVIFFFISALATFVATSAHAGAPLCEAIPSRAPNAVSATNGITVIEASPQVHAGELRRYGYKVRSLAATRDAWEDPDPQLRDRLLGLAGLSSVVARWDQLARDQIFLRAQHYSLTKLAVKYPRVPRARLHALQNAIGAEKRRGGAR